MLKIENNATVFIWYLWGNSYLMQKIINSFKLWQWITALRSSKRAERRKPLTVTASLPFESLHLFNGKGPGLTIQNVVSIISSVIQFALLKNSSSINFHFFNLFLIGDVTIPIFFNFKVQVSPIRLHNENVCNVTSMQHVVLMLSSTIHYCWFHLMYTHLFGRSFAVRMLSQRLVSRAVSKFPSMQFGITSASASLRTKRKMSADRHVSVKVCSWKNERTARRSQSVAPFRCSRSYFTQRSNNRSRKYFSHAPSLVRKRGFASGPHSAGL